MNAKPSPYVTIELHTKDAPVRLEDGIDWTPIKDARPIRHMETFTVHPGALTADMVKLWEETCASFIVRGPIAISFHMDHEMRMRSGFDLYKVRGEVVTDDVNRPGHEVALSFGRVVPAHLRTKQEIIHYLRSLAHWFYLHECDERIEVDGVRTHIPHEDHG